MKNKNAAIKQGKKSNKTNTIIIGSIPQANIFNIQSKYIMKIIFGYIPKKKQYNICYRSNKLQKILGISLITYQMIHFLSDKSLKLDFIQLIEIIKQKYPHSSQNDIIEFLWNKFSEDSNPIILTQINHSSIPQLKSLIELNNSPNEKIFLSIINNKQFTIPLTSNQISILKHITAFTYDFLISTLNQKGFETLCDNLKYISSNNLTKLHLSGLKLNYCLNKDKFTDVIEEFKALKELDLSNNILKDEGMILLFNSVKKNNLTQLMYLKISDNFFTDSSIGFIEMIMQSTQDSLKHFDISSNFLSGKSIKIIIKYTGKLNYLNLSNNPICNEGLITLLSSIKHKSLCSITELCLANINIKSFDLLTHVDLFGELANTPLIKFDFSGNSMDGISLEVFTSQIEKIITLESLMLSYFFIDRPTSLNSLSKLKQLSLSFCTHIDNIFSHSFNLTNLTSLNITLNTFTNNYPSMEFMRSLTQLIILDISNCNIHMEVFSSLWKCFSNTLQELYMGHNDFTTKSVISLSSALMTYSNLTIFDISNNAINKDELKLILQSLKYCKQVTSFNFTNVQFDYDNFEILLKLLKELKHITELYLFNIAMSDNQLKDIFENKELLIRLKILNISKNSINNNGINEIIRKKGLLVSIKKLFLMQLVISTQIKEDLKSLFGDAVYLK